LGQQLAICSCFFSVISFKLQNKELLCQIARTFERAPLFPMTNIHDLGMTDTEYAKLLAQGYKPNLEYQLVKLGESIEQARKLARVVG
jgi:hypothetical protein